MTNDLVDQTLFIVLVSSIRQRASAHLLIDSLRSFGGGLSCCPIWLVETHPQKVSCSGMEGAGVRVLPLTIPEVVGHYWFASKVYACAQAEEMASAEVRSLIWLSSDCLIIKPPMLFDLGSFFDVAVRPVHI